MQNAAKKRRFKWVEAPATSRHTSHTLRLLPSGPDRVHELSLREDQGLHRFCSAKGVSPKAGWIIQYPCPDCNPMTE